MGNCARELENRTDSLYGKYIPTAKIQAEAKKQELQTPQRVANTDPTKISSLKEILKSNEDKKIKKDHENNIKRAHKDARPIPTLIFDERELTVQTPVVPSFDYALMMK